MGHLRSRYFPSIRPAVPPPPLIFVRSQQAYYISANNEDIDTKLSGYDPCDLSSTNKNLVSFGWVGMITMGSFSLFSLYLSQ